MTGAHFVRAGEGERVAFPALGINMQVLVPLAAAGGDFCVLHEETAPGGGPPLHVHDRQTELFLILEGDYELAVGDQRFRAGPGDVAVVPPGTRTPSATPGPAAAASSSSSARRWRASASSAASSSCSSAASTIPPSSTASPSRSGPSSSVHRWRRRIERRATAAIGRGSRTQLERSAFRQAEALVRCQIRQVIAHEGAGGRTVSADLAYQLLCVVNGNELCNRHVRPGRGMCAAVRLRRLRRSPALGEDGRARPAALCRAQRLASGGKGRAGRSGS